MNAIQITARHRVKRDNLVWELSTASHEPDVYGKPQTLTRVTLHPSLSSACHAAFEESIGDVERADLAGLIQKIDSARDEICATVVRELGTLFRESRKDSK